MEKIEIAGGSVAGRDHSRVGKNAQDGFYWEEAAGVLVAVVCDGCGSGAHSEVGAKLGAKIVARQTLLGYLQDPKSFEPLPKSGIVPGLDRVKRSTLISLSSTAKDMGGSYSQNVSDYFLFTILGAVVDPANGVKVFGCGDGVYYWNGFPVFVSYPNNAPPYLAYGLVETTQEEPELKRLAAFPFEQFNNLLLGTDGFGDLAKAQDLLVPGKEEKIGPVSQFWEKDCFFKNPFSIGHRLALINRSVSRMDWEKKALAEAHGPLHDDTTLVVVRRAKR